MPTVADIMTTDVRSIEPQESLRSAAKLMQMLNVGALPVCSGKQLLGMVTDRDIVVRGIAAGLQGEKACVSDVMTGSVRSCTPDQDVHQVMQQMGQAQVRRMPVLGAAGALVGIVSLGDVALRQAGHTDATLREISEPGSTAAGGPR